MLDTIAFFGNNSTESYLKVSDFLATQNSNVAVFLVLVGILLTVGGFMFAKLNSLEKGQTEIRVTLGEMKAVMSMTKAIELGTTQEEVLERAKKEVEEKAKSEN
jgi:hypothetical protein